MAQQYKVGKCETKIFKTPLEGGGQLIECQYHNTVVASINTLTGKIRLNSGGYRTKTTRTRMNQFLAEYCNLPNVRVIQRDYSWYVTQTIRGNTGTMDFEDNMTFDRFGLFELEAVAL